MPQQPPTEPPNLPQSTVGRGLDLRPSSVPLSTSSSHAESMPAIDPTIQLSLGDSSMGNSSNGLLPPVRTVTSPQLSDSFSAVMNGVSASSEEAPPLAVTQFPPATPLLNQSYRQHQHSHSHHHSLPFPPAHYQAPPLSTSTSASMALPPLHYPHPSHSNASLPPLQSPGNITSAYVSPPRPRSPASQLEAASPRPAKRARDLVAGMETGGIEPISLEGDVLCAGGRGGRRSESAPTSPLVLREVIRALAAIPQDADLAAYNSIASWIYRVFSDPIFLSSSFLEPLSDTDPSPSDRMTDRGEVKEFIALLKSRCPPQLHKHRAHATQVLLESLKSTPPAPNADRAAILAILFMDEPVTSGDLPITSMEGACEALVSLTEPELARFFLLLTRPSKGEVERGTDITKLIGRIHAHIDVRIKNLIAAKVPITHDSSIYATLSALGCIHKLNHPVDGPIGWRAFVQELMCEVVNVTDDIAIHSYDIDRSVCRAFPWALTTEIKSQFLLAECLHRQHHELQDAFFRALFIGVNSPYLELRIRRDRLVRDAVYQLENCDGADLLKALKVQFVGEEGVDEGGLRKEFFSLLAREVFCSDYGMFVWREASRLCWFAPAPDPIASGASGMEGPQQEEYRLVGIMLGLAIYNNVQLEVKLPRAAYKRLCGRPVGMEDLLDLDPDLGRGLVQLLEMSEEEVTAMDMTFDVDIPWYGQSKSVPLVPDGDKIPVTIENRQEYVDRYVQWVFVDSVKLQYGAFQAGFRLLSQKNPSTTELFQPEELELIVCGSKILDFDALEAACKYDGGFTKESPLIQEFWRLVQEMEEMDRRRLLTFVTGSDRAPSGGLGQLSFTITRNGGDSNRLPTAHTCFNTLLLNEYEQVEDLKLRLMTAIRNDEGFGLM